MSRIAILIFLNLILLAWFSIPSSSLAGNLRLLGDWTYSNTSSETKDRLTQERTDSESRRLSQIYRLDLTQELGPTLFLTGGAQLEDNDQRNESDSGDTRTEGSTVRPYVNLQWLTPLYTLSGGYEEREAKTKTTGNATQRDFSETTTGRFYWRPVDLPTLELDYARTLRHDEPLTHDNESQVYRLSSKYTWEDLEFLYSYLRSDEQEKIADTEALTQTHNGRVRYASTFLDNRLSVSAGARMERSMVEFSGATQPRIRTFPIGAGFFLLNDSDPTSTNLALTPYTPTSEEPFTTINLGSTGPSTPISLGLDFGENIQVDVLEVLLQANESTLDQLTSTSFDFRVFISNDQENWTEIGATHLWDPLNNLYSIDLASQVNAEFIKVTTFALPVSSGITDEIVVLDMRAFVIPPADITEIISTYQSLNAGLSWKATDKTQVLFDSSYQYRETDLFDDARARLSNSLSLIHRFNPIFSGTTRLLRSDAWEQWKHDTATTSYSAQLSGRYLPTLNQSLTYSGMRTEEPEGKSVNNAIILRTNAAMYTGWDLSFDQGYNWQDPVTGKDSSSFFVRLQNSLIPHPRLTLIADYSIRWQQKEDEPTERGETGRVRATWSPTDNLSFNGEVRQRRSEGDLYTYWEYGVGWLPLRDGTLQFNLSYYEDGDTDDDRRRSFSPSLTWSVTDSATLRVLYNIGRQEVREEMTDYQSVMVNFRIYTN
ncbi:hypothetical protein [Desulfuromonas sp. AOP6]|uniref:hypothetical protein n=1 Tax=Desulfuromonas sp. AOP6 TaxID=1566351 RepID=UPI00127621BD|nr:hypothetical protein [Desulfuromonas sp. AOP6]BCA79877.1 hypothetical protein AOP6_1664 [Desulfuromonas sp. AOP6]